MSEEVQPQNGTGFDELLKQSPEGVKVTGDKANVVNIMLEPTGARSRSVLLSIVVLATVIGGAFMFSMRSTPTHIPLIWALSEVALICILLYYMKGCIYITLTPSTVSVQTLLMGHRRGWTVQCNEIQEVLQPRSGGSSSVYGHLTRDVLVKANEIYSVAFSEKPDRADWLAKVLTAASCSASPQLQQRPNK